MKENIELGCYRDNEEALRTARYDLGRAKDSRSMESAISSLTRLRDHILSSADPKSISILLPVVLALLKNPGAYAGVLRTTAVSPGHKTGSLVRNSQAPYKHPAISPHQQWLAKFLDSMLPKESFLCMHFLLVLSLLSFTLAISAFLSRFDVGIRSYVEPMLHITDVFLIGVFCAECLTLLTMTVAEEILKKIRSIRQDGNGRPGSRKIYPAVDHPALNAFRQTSEQQIGFFEKEQAGGRFMKDAVEMPHAFETLGQTHSSFDAVSRDELPFWLPDPSDPFAEEYYRLGMDLARSGKQVTRIFVLSQEQIEQAGVLKQVLLKHLLDGIGFAVVPFDPLPTHLRKRARELDFGLWDHGSAYSVFRQREGGYARKMEIVFSCAGRNSDVTTKLSLYREILPHAWLVDRVYTDCQKEMISELLPRLKANNDHLLRRISGKIEPEGVFYFNVASEAELSEKVDRLLELWRLACNTERNQFRVQEFERAEHAHERQ